MIGLFFLFLLPTPTLKFSLGRKRWSRSWCFAPDSVNLIFAHTHEVTLTADEVKTPYYTENVSESIPLKGLDTYTK